MIVTVWVFGVFGFAAVRNNARPFGADLFAAASLDFMPFRTFSIALSLSFSMAFSCCNLRVLLLLFLLEA